MRCLSKKLDKHASGGIHVMAEDAEDIWTLYNVIVTGDGVRTSTFRKVQSESQTGSVQNEKKHITLSIRVEDTTYDGYAHVIHCKGKVSRENKYVKMHQYHTVDVIIGQKCWISKADWDTINLKRIDEACNIHAKAEVGAVVLQEGLANICLLTSTISIPLLKIEHTVSKKRIGSNKHVHSLNKFLQLVVDGTQRHFDFGKLKAMIIASPGFLKDQLFKVLLEDALKQHNKTLLEFKDKIVLLHGSSGHFHSLNELLADKSVQEKLKETKCMEQMHQMQRFYDMMGTDSRKAWYGYGHVRKAFEFGAIDTLLISDALFRHPDVKTRHRYIGLAEEAESIGAKVFIISTLHVSGEQLKDLTGVAAILMFPMEDE